jgi:hypothetical protein
MEIVDSHDLGKIGDCWVSEYFLSDGSKARIVSDCADGGSRMFDDRDKLIRMGLVAQEEFDLYVKKVEATICSDLS